VQKNGHRRFALAAATTQRLSSFTNSLAEITSWAIAMSLQMKHCPAARLTPIVIAFAIATSGCQPMASNKTSTGGLSAKAGSTSPFIGGKPIAAEANSRYATGGIMPVSFDEPVATAPVATNGVTTSTVAAAPMASVPRELAKVILPDYRIEPPDIVQIDAIHIAPKAPYRLRAFDSLVVTAPAALPDAPINGAYTVEPGGMIDFGNPYGRVRVLDMTVEEAQAAIEKKLAEALTDAKTSVSLGDIAAKQQISGQHLVSQDGKVTLGSYGKVQIVGMTVAEAKAAIERHLSQTLEQPEVSLDVFAYNSKVFYIITQGAGQGDGVARFAITGNDTVLDAISLINGLAPTSSTRIWVARPGRDFSGCHQILPVDWYMITQCGDTQTNYQLLPGDRVYVAEDRLMSFDTWLGKALAPWERIFGFVSLGTNTVSSVTFFKQQGQRGFGGF
jgi:polysaccharide export outer membrane protein